jgi:hypothetical protein
MKTEFKDSGYKNHNGTAKLGCVYNTHNTAETSDEAASFGDKARRLFEEGYKIVAVKQWMGTRWLGRLYAVKNKEWQELPR